MSYVSHLLYFLNACKLELSRVLHLHHGPYKCYDIRSTFLLLSEMTTENSFVLQVGIPADREQYIHRLGRTGRKGKEGQGLLLLAPWEKYFLGTVKDLSISEAAVPAVDSSVETEVSNLL